MNTYSGVLETVASQVRLDSYMFFPILNMQMYEYNTFLNYIGLFFFYKNYIGVVLRAPQSPHMRCDNRFWVIVTFVYAYTRIKFVMHALTFHV